MAQFSQPTKQQVRAYIEKRVESRKPLPSMKEIRRNLGWELVELARNGTGRR